MSAEAARACIECGGSDEHPPQHCDDCPLLAHVPPSFPVSNNGRGCESCGFTGLASGPAFSRLTASVCPACGKRPQCKRLRRIARELRAAEKRAASLSERLYAAGAWTGTQRSRGQLRAKLATACEARDRLLREMSDATKGDAREERR